MKRGKRELTGEEKQLWRRVVAGVKPRRGGVAADAPAPEGARPRAPSAPARLAPGIDKVAAKSGPPADRKGEKRVRRGKLAIGATLDLHGHTQTTGRAALVRFLLAAQSRGDKTVVVVTGVGRGGEGILRKRLPEWLAEPELRSLASGFAKAHRTHGGEGAYYVFPRRAGHS